MNNETERTLHELKLPGMASCWSSLEETHQLDKLTLREGMQIMLQHERDTRGNNRIQRLIKNAGFRLKASMEDAENGAYPPTQNGLIHPQLLLKWP